MQIPTGDLRTITKQPHIFPLTLPLFRYKADLLVFCQVHLVFHVQDRLAEWKV